jgi:hypothetical protein
MKNEKESIRKQRSQGEPILPNFFLLKSFSFVAIKLGNFIVHAFFSYVTHTLKLNSEDQ